MLTHIVRLSNSQLGTYIHFPSSYANAAEILSAEDWKSLLSSSEPRVKGKVIL